MRLVTFIFVLLSFQCFSLTRECIQERIKTNEEFIKKTEEIQNASGTVDEKKKLTEELQLKKTQQEEDWKKRCQ